MLRRSDRSAQPGEAGTNCSDRLLTAVDELLRGAGRCAADSASVPMRRLLLVLTITGALFGAAMGSFAGRAEQSFHSALKVPLLLTTSTAIALPSFYAVNSALGLRDDFAAAWRGILAAQATLAVALLALAPLLLLAYASSDDYPSAVQASGICFLLATLAGQVTLSRHYARLVAKDRRHRHARRVWALVYAFVAIQSAWVMRPFVGAPTLKPAFFREHAWSNAYVVLVRDVLELGEKKR